MGGTHLRRILHGTQKLYQMIKSASWQSHDALYLCLVHASLAGRTVPRTAAVFSGTVRFTDAAAVTAALAVTAAEAVSGIPLLHKIANDTADDCCKQ